MNKLAFFTLLCVSGVFFALDTPAQVTPQTSTGNPRGSLTSGTIDSQFIYLSRISRTEEDFKLIRRRNLDIIRQNVADSLDMLRKEAADTRGQIPVLSNEIAGLKDSLSITKQELENVLQSERTTSFFGIRLPTMTYHLIVWGLIILLIILLSYSLIKMGQNNVTTREAKNTLDNLQAEYDQHRKKSLEKEQKLMRQLQDEINKGNT